MIDPDTTKRGVIGDMGRCVIVLGVDLVHTRPTNILKVALDQAIVCGTHMRGKPIREHGWFPEDGIGGAGSMHDRPTMVGEQMC